ncbi:MAG: hypothetical protein IT323_02530 [Anaerolineae bacterium]|nr:hypothetical protein [Anaerolineae bacterium]
MRPTSYDQRQIDDEYCKDRVREAEMARLALEAAEPHEPRRTAQSAWVMRFASASQHVLVPSAKMLRRAWKAGREDVRRLIYWATHRPRHT